MDKETDMEQESNVIGGINGNGEYVARSSGLPESADRDNDLTAGDVAGHWEYLAWCAQQDLEHSRNQDSAMADALWGTAKVLA